MKFLPKIAKHFFLFLFCFWKIQRLISVNLFTMAKLCTTPLQNKLTKLKREKEERRKTPWLTCLRRAVYLLFCGYFVYLRIFVNVHVPEKISIRRVLERGCRQETYLNKILIGKCHPLTNIYPSYLSRHAKNRRAGKFDFQ